MFSNAGNAERFVSKTLIIFIKYCKDISLIILAFDLSFRKSYSYRLLDTQFLHL